MIEIDPNNRYNSFNEINNEISNYLLNDIDFSDGDKEIYRYFADKLVSHISYFNNSCNLIDDRQAILSNLQQLIRCSNLEEYIQDNSMLINCFVKGNYTYFREKNISVSMVIKFYEFLSNLNNDKQDIVFDNLRTRLKAVKVKRDEDLPFF